MLSLVLVLLPVLFFYLVLFRKINNLPFADDYEILVFLHHLTHLHGPASKAVYLLTAQHNEYKLILDHGVSAVQYYLLGHVSFAGLCLIGDCAVLMVGLLLWTMFLPQQPDLSRRLALFIPVSWLMFQLSYAETLNWAEAAIQNLYVLVFAFAAFLLAFGKQRYRFMLALLCLALTICASGNGFIAAAAGFLVLLKERRFGRAGAWTAVTLGMIALYAYRYNVQSSQSPKQHSVFAALLDLKVVYIVSFLGSVGEIGHLVPHVTMLGGSIFLGVLLIAFIAYSGIRGQLSTSPAVNAAIVFVLLTAVGVAGLRSDFGADQSISSRYRIYSSLMLILVWFLIAERSLQFTNKPLVRNWLYVSGTTAAIALSLVLDVSGTRALNAKNTSTINGMRAYEHPDHPGSTNGPVLLDPTQPAAFTPAFNDMARRLLSEARIEGTYQPPTYP